MTKRYKILQKKLQELEAELELLLSPAETPRHHFLSENIQQRFEFLKNLLSAEIASHPSKPSHLRHIGRRLTELEIIFLGWDNNFDTASVCSCNESSRNDDGEAAFDLPNYPELGCSEDELQQSCRRALVKVKVKEEGKEEQRNCDLCSCETVEDQQRDSPRQKLNVEEPGKVGIEDDLGSFEHEVKQSSTPLWNEVAVEKNEGRRISALCKYFGVLIGGMILGMILMGASIAMIGDCGFSYSTPHEGFRFPT